MKLSLRNLKLANKLVELGQTRLWQFKKARVLFARTGDAHAMSSLRETFGLPKEATGRLGKIALDAMKKQRKFAAFAHRELTGGHLKMKVSLKGGLKDIRQWHLGGGMFRADAAKGGKHASIAKDMADQYAAASKALGDRLVNARGRGVRFVRIKGRIVPIRGKK